ncbi:MAG TPA: hypothetical protein VK932_31420 [Kofleriaceae bacterium]|nr:hypothetical protein [Kofleriaceae bacterium]
MARLAVLAAMLCGCAQLFGLDETSGGPPSASLSFERVSIGARVVTAPQDLSGSMATYLVPDDADPTGLARVAAIEVEPGRWTAPITRPAPVLFDLPDYPEPVLRIFDFPQVEVKGLFGVLEHPSPQPAPEGATITVNTTLDVPFNGTDRFELFTLGSWNAVALAAPAVGATVLTQTFPFTAMSSLTGRMPHERITADDAAVVLRYAGNELRGAVRAAPFDQTGADTVSGPLTTVELQPFSFAIDQVDLMRRYGLARPLAGTPSMQWTLRAAPGAQLNTDLGPLLAAGGPTDATTVSSQAGNPFAPDWPSTVLWLTRASRTYTPPAAGLPVTLFAGMHERAILESGLQMKLPAGLPTRITLIGTVLENDGVTIAKPARGVEVSFQTDVPENTMYQLQLFKLVPNAAMTALQYELKLGANGVQPRFVLPPELFEAGALYTLRAITVAGGFPGIAEGDLTQRSIPIAVSFLDSGVFQVAP